MKRRKLNKILASLAGAAFMLPAASFANLNLVTDGGFEIAPVPNSFLTEGSSLGAWTIAQGSVDLIGGYWQPAGGLESLDAAGLQNGTIRQTLNVPTSGDYLLTFAMSGNPDGLPPTKQLTVSFGSGLVSSFTYDTIRNGTAYNSHSDMKWEQRSWMVHLTQGLIDLSFQDTSAAANGWSPTGTTPWGAALDNISLTAVPEPTTIVAGALVLLPFGLSTVRVLRSRK